MANSFSLEQNDPHSHKHTLKHTQTHTLNPYTFTHPHIYTQTRQTRLQYTHTTHPETHTLSHTLTQRLTHTYTHTLI